jgi:hypothetical protein
MSERKLERLHAGLVKLASLDDSVLAALVEPSSESPGEVDLGDLGAALSADARFASPRMAPRASGSALRAH